MVIYNNLLIISVILQNDRDCFANTPNDNSILSSQGVKNERPARRLARRSDLLKIIKLNPFIRS